VTVYNSETGLDSSFISAVAPSDEGLLVGTFYSDRDGGGLQRQVGEAEWESLDFPSVNTEDDPTQLSNRVTTLLVDPDSGDIWAGTTTGLGRYDGSEWTRYGVDEGLPNAVVTALKMVEGILLVGTQDGLAAFNGESFDAVSEVTLQSITGIVPASDGSVWLSGGGGIWRRNPDGEWVSWDYTDMPSYGLYSGVEGPNGTLYFGSEDGLVTFQGDDYNFWRAPAVPVHEAFDRILPRPDAGELWFSEEYGPEPDILNTSDLVWQPPPDGSACDGCDPLVFDETGRAWAGGDSGLWVFETSDEISHYTTGDGLPSDLVRSVAVGPEGTAWIGTDAGLAYFDNGEFPTIYDTSNSELKDNYVVVLLLASDGSLWVGTNSGLNRVLDDGTLLTYGQDNPFGYDVGIYDVAEAPDGDIWVATKGNGLFRYHPADDAWDHYGPEVQGVALDSNDYNCVAVAADGSVWVGGTFDYAHYYDGETWYAFGIEQGLIHSNVNDIYVDAEGVVWFATSGGVTRYEP
jgi:ligand-binding sensor domain-containing protein